MAGEDVGNSYAIGQGTLNNTNYAISYTGANFSITQLPVTVTANSGQGKVYGSVDPTLTFTSSPAVGSSLANGLTISYSGTLSRMAGEDVGNSYAIGQGTLNNTNYAITYSGANFSITQLPVSVTANIGQGKVYGTADPASYSFSSNPANGSTLANGDVVSFTGALTRVAGELVGNYAILQGTLANSNYAISYNSNNFSITPAPTTTTVIVTPGTAQYSDRVTITSTIAGGAPLVSAGPSGAAVSATFKIRNQVMGTVDYVIVGSDLVATLANVALVELPTANAQMAPGTASVAVTNNSTNTNYTVASTAFSNMTITKEDARVLYTGLTYQATASSSTGSATVLLTASVSDITAILGDPAYDANAGDIRNARVKFVNRDNNSDISGWLTPTLSNAGDTKNGFVQFSNTFNIGNADAGLFTVGIVVDNGYYIRNSNDDNTVITIYKPLGDFVTGGGHTIVQSSAGSYAATTGTKMNFGLNVKYNKTGKNVQGNVNMIFRKVVAGVTRVYQIKSNATNSLGTSGSTGNRSAQFTAKANLMDITDVLNPIAIVGGADLQVSLSDKGEPGTNDEIGVTLTSGGVMFFSSNWVVNTTVKQVISGGNININGGNINARISAEEPALLSDIDNFEIISGANPSFGAYRFKVSSNNERSVQLDLIDSFGVNISKMNIKPNADVEIGGNLKAGVYLMHLSRGNIQKTVKIIFQ